MVKKIHVKGYSRRGRKGKLDTVKSYDRKKRKLGKKVKFKPVGQFFVGHDELGNFRGSKIVVKGDKKQKGLKRLRVLTYNNSSELDSDYFKGKISYRQWINARKSIMKLR